MLFNFLVGSSLHKKNNFSQKYILIFGISCNIGLLGYFKYSDFFLQGINSVFDGKIELLYLALPLAISFFTFQQIAYLVDSFRGETKEYDFLNYAVFVTFFPQLIAGPIVHHKEMMPQFEKIKNKIINYKNISKGIFIFSIGLFKKVVIADTFAIWATNGFDKAETLTLIEAWATSLAYTFQLYFDFSGYTDMAIGLALLFNIKLPINFNSPYKAVNIQEFWRRWHITLSRFLKDYIYIPLGGNRNDEYQTYSNLIVTFLIGGLWHGAGWTFILWGFLHGAALILHRVWKKLEFKIPKILAWFITFNFVNIAWVFFRAKEFEDAMKILQGMSGFNGMILPTILYAKLNFLIEYNIKFGKWLDGIAGDNWSVFWFLGSFILILSFKNSNEFLENFEFRVRTAVLTSIILMFGLLSLNQVSEFLYFSF